VSDTTIITDPTVCDGKEGGEWVGYLNYVGSLF